MPPKKSRGKGAKGPVPRVAVEVHQRAEDLEDDPSDDEGSDKRVSKRPRSKSTRYPGDIFESPCKTGYAKVFLQNVKL
jgi:hypothetical protein